MSKAGRAALTQALLVLLLQTAAFLVPSAAGAGPTTCAAIDSLKRLAEFFSHNVDRVDADGYFGVLIASIALRSAPLTLTAFADECGESQVVELVRARAHLEHLLRAFRSRFSSTAASETRGYNGVTYRQICVPLEAIVRRRLRAGIFRWRRLKDGHQHIRNSATHGSFSSSTETRLISDLKNAENYNESSGDACYREIAKMEKQRCSISPMCKNFFLNSRFLSGYGLTHQFIYWLFIIEKSCQEKLSDGSRVDGSLLDETCGKSYSQYTQILRSGRTSDTGLIDLMIEHAVICGLYGFRDFFADSTVLLLRRLQNERLGCLPESTSSEIKVESARTDKTAAAISPGMKKSEATGRKLMHDVLLDGICSSHTNGLAAAYFALFLRT